MGGSFALSLAAIDILLERLGLGAAPFPFEIPHHGRTQGERAAIRDGVLADLERRGLIDEGAAVVRLFARPAVVITAFGLQEGGPLFARVCGVGRQAVTAVGKGDGVHFERIRPTALVAAAVGLLPVERAGSGQPVTIPGEGAEGPEVGVVVRAPASQVVRARAILERERLRFGQFRVGVRGRPGADVFWFDTGEGRYLMTSSAGRDGLVWTTISPADGKRIGQVLSARLRFGRV
jgi:hypothetical protein